VKKKNADRYFRIRNLATGKFSKGGSGAFYDHSSYWSSTGKVWKGTGPLRNHLNVVIETHGTIPTNWEVIEYEFNVVAVENASKYVDILKLLKK